MESEEIAAKKQTLDPKIRQKVRYAYSRIFISNSSQPSPLRSVIAGSTAGAVEIGTQPTI
jgi:hypothetical protein